MEESTKMKLFDEMLRLETLANSKTYDGRDYFEQAEGAYNMLQVLGLGGEYIRWSEGKWWKGDRHDS